VVVVVGEGSRPTSARKRVAVGRAAVVEAPTNTSVVQMRGVVVWSVAATVARSRRPVL